MKSDCINEEIHLVINNGTNIVYEEAEKFSRSIHKEAYKRAYDITEKIIRQNRALSGLKSGKPNRQNTSTTIRNLEQMSNILFFSGERGAGKTSSMLSYMEFLKDYYRNVHSQEKNQKIGNLEFSEIDLMFTGLEYIDASRLADKEDILGSVLAKMVKKWLDEEKKSYPNNGLQKSRDYEYKKRQLQMQFNEVYQCLSALETSQQILDQDNDMFIDTLQKLSFTGNLKESFEKLIEQYVEIMQYSGAGKTNHYLVIPIDDLDMNIKNGYTLLEQIRKYLMVPNVIVMISANYNQLEKICYNHYKQEFKYLKEEDSYIKRLTREYLEKIVPDNHQIHLKSGHDGDIFNREKIIFEYMNENKNSIEPLNYGSYEMSQGGLEILEGKTLGEVVQNLMKTRFGMRFSIKSKCLQYLMPDTLRSVMSWLNKVVPLSKNTDITAEQFRKNMAVFWEDLFPGVLRNHLTPEEKEKIDNLMLMDVFEQKKWLKDYQKAMIGEKNFLFSSRNSENAVYIRESIAELFWKLHNSVPGNDTMYTILVLYFTAKLSELVGYIRLDQTEIGKNSLKELRRYYQGGLFGESENEIIPEMVRVSDIFDKNKADNDSAVPQKLNSALSTDSPSITQYAKLAYKTIDSQKAKLSPDFLNIKFSRNEKEMKTAFTKKTESNHMKEYCGKLLFYSFIPKSSFHYEIQSDKWRFINEREGAFSLSGALIFQSIGSELKDVFFDKLDEAMEIYGIKRDDLQNKDSVYYTDYLGSDVKKYFPVDSLEFIIDIGDWLRDRKENALRIEAIDRNEINQAIEGLLRNYFDRWLKCFTELDASYHTNYHTDFLESPLGLEIGEGKIKFIAELAIQMANESAWYNKIPDESEWGRD